jgi:hypothetical protein
MRITSNIGRRLPEPTTEALSSSIEHGLLYDSIVASGRALEIKLPDLISSYNHRHDFGILAKLMRE